MTTAWRPTARHPQLPEHGAWCRQTLRCETKAEDCDHEGASKGKLKGKLSPVSPCMKAQTTHEKGCFLDFGYDPQFSPR